MAEHDSKCRCWHCRHERFNPGAPSTPKQANFYGHFKRGQDRKRYRVNLIHYFATIEDAVRDTLRKVL